MRRAIEITRAPTPIQDTIRYWRNVGVNPGDVWESVTGHRRHHVLWGEVAALLMAETMNASEAA